MVLAVNFTAVAVVFKNECTRDLSLRAKSPLFGQLLVLVLVLLVLVVLMLVLVDMLQFFLSTKAGRFLIFGPDRFFENVLDIRRAPRRLACPRRLRGLGVAPIWTFTVYLR